MNDSCWRASMNPVEDVFAIEPPSSNAESLRDQQAAQVRATDSLFVTTDKFCDLERGQQPIRQSSIVGWHFGRLHCVRSMRRFGVGDLPHRSSSAHLWRRSRRRVTPFVMDVPSRFVPRGVKDLRSITAAAGSVGGFRADAWARALVCA
jgi:hypothetical protein